MQLADACFEEMVLGPYPSQFTPILEMSCLRRPGPTGGWEEPVNYAGGGWGEAHWVVEDKGGRRLCQTRTESLYDNVILVKGDEDWRDYRVGARIRLEDEPLRVGVIFRFETALNYYAAVLAGPDLQIIRRLEDECTVLARTTCKAPRDPFDLVADVSGTTITASLNGKEILSAKDACLSHGKAGIYSWSRAAFLGFEVTCGEQEEARLETTRARKSVGIAAKQNNYPLMKRALEIKTRGITGGKLFRFGDLTASGDLDILIGMAHAKHRGIACLTAVNQKGETIWQKGAPIDEPALITSDFPVQIVDFDGDGRNEVLTVWDNRFVVLDGATGEEKRSGPLPMRPPADPTPCHVHGTSWFRDCLIDKEEELIPTYIRPCNLTGRDKGFDFICGYGYPFLWGFSNEMEQMWQFTGNVGHFAYAYDADGDGIDEIQCGYARLKGDGSWIFSLHQGDHADAVFFSNRNHPRGDGRLMIYAAGGDDGLLFFDDQGYFRPLRRGHVQRLSIGKYRRDVPGYQVACVTYWGAPGICTMYDQWGAELWSRSLPVCGSNLNPVNWTGDGNELMLFSAHRDIGGLMDAEGDIVVRFPDDDHPELWCESFDFFGNGRDAIVTMDRERIVVYAPDDEPGGNLYAPDRPPLWAWSNFMANFSLEL